MTPEEARKQLVAELDKVLNLSSWILHGHQRDLVVAGRSYFQTASVEDLTRFISLIPPE